MPSYPYYWTNVSSFLCVGMCGLDGKFLETNMNYKNMKNNKMLIDWYYLRIDKIRQKKNKQKTTDHSECRQRQMKNSNCSIWLAHAWWDKSEWYRTIRQHTIYTDIKQTTKKHEQNELPWKCYKYYRNSGL